jgi:hypothetical protein
MTNEEIIQYIANVVFIAAADVKRSMQTIRSEINSNQTRRIT